MLQMVNYNLNNNFLKKEIALFILLYFSLLISFYIGENSTGGAIIDYNGQKEVSKDFAGSFISTLLNYDNYGTRHSPILIIFLSFFERLDLSDQFIRLTHLHVCLLLPLIFYQSLKIKFKNIDEKILILLTGLIFLSPTFRSLSIWPDSRNFGLMFFILSIYFFLKFEIYGTVKFAYFNILFLAISSYFSPNFSVFGIYFLIKFFNFYSYKSKEFYKIILLNFILAFPAFYYIFYLNINFMNKPAGIGINESNIIFRNIFNQIMIIPTIIVFYLIPFLITRIIDLKIKLELKFIVITTIIFCLSVFYFDYNYDFTGGGIFFKASHLFFNNNILFYLISFLSIYLLTQMVTKEHINFLILILIFLNNPQETIYHKYYDPFLIVSFFLLFNLNINFENLQIKKNLIFLYIYFLSFLVLSFFKIYV
jgi:hypothetical protein